MCLYLLDDETPGRHRVGAAQRWWLHESLAGLAQSLEKRGAFLTLRRGRAEAEIPKLVREIGAAAVFWNRCYEPFATARDTGLKQTLIESGVAVESFQANLLFEPWTIRTKGGEPFKVFTPFWRTCRASPSQRRLIPAPRRLNGMAVRSEQLASWKLQPSKPNWAARFPDHWTPGEAGAQAALDRFIYAALRDYPGGRDRTDREGTSRLSPHLHWGEISPLQVWSKVQALADERPSLGGSTEKFFSELGWREFSYHLLFHWPHIAERNWRESFDAFPWRRDNKALAAWKAGRTGYPLVDAGMRELWATGWMHNRARMVCASFLVKHLLLDWREGEAWFWDTLVDADLANNAASWQWVAGSGADAAPYFRIFNPTTQGARYDPHGAYVRRWIPELANLPDEVIHEPWKATETQRRGYSAPIVDHAAARARALEAFATLRSGA